MKYEECKRCGRKLTQQDSQEVGYGPTCYKKYIKEKKLYTPLFDVDELPYVKGEETHENNSSVAVQVHRKGTV